VGVECIQQQQQQQGESFAAVNFILILASCVRMAQKHSAGKRTHSDRRVSIATPDHPLALSLPWRVIEARGVIDIEIVGC